MTAQHSTQQQLSLDILEVILEMHKETVFSRLNPDFDKMLRSIESIIENGFVYYDGKCLFMGKLFKPWYNDDIHATDFITYTRKDFRGEGLAKLAISQFIEWAKEKGATSIKISQSSGIKNKEYSAMAKSLNLKKVGEIYNV